MVTLSSRGAGGIVTGADQTLLTSLHLSFPCLQQLQHEEFCDDQLRLREVCRWHKSGHGGNTSQVISSTPITFIEESTVGFMWVIWPGSPTHADSHSSRLGNLNSEKGKYSSDKMARYVCTVYFPNIWPSELICYFIFISRARPMVDRLATDCSDYGFYA